MENVVGFVFIYFLIKVVLMMLTRLRVGRQQRKTSNRRMHKGDQYYRVLSEL